MQEELPLLLAHGREQLLGTTRKDAGYKMGDVAWLKLRIKSRGGCFLLCEPLQNSSGGFGVPLAQSSFKIGVTQAPGCTLRELQKAKKNNRSKHSQSQTHLQYWAIAVPAP